MNNELDFVLTHNNEKICFKYLTTLYPKNDDNQPGYCKFHIQADKEEYVYLWILNNEIQYIGQTVNLYRQFNTGFGYISDRNLKADGQRTNCRLNKAAFNEMQNNNFFKIYVYKTKNSKELKRNLLPHISTKYNKR